MIRVLLIEDSRTVAAYLEAVLRAAPDFEVLPTAFDGLSGLEVACSQRPDVVLMDLELPGLDGISAIERIMETDPRPIVVLSAHLHAPGRDRAFESLEAGAVEVLAKPSGLSAGEVEGFRGKLLQTVRLMAGARVVRRWGRRRRSVVSALPGLQSAPKRGLSGAGEASLAALQGLSRPQIVLIAGSTGGPPLIEHLLRVIAPPSAIPIVIAQHTIAGFEEGLARWLCGTGHAVRVAREGGFFVSGEVLLARADRHLAVRAGRVALEPVMGSGPVPSADVLFGSAAEAYGSSALALLLSGMGSDGARGLLALRKSGATTITQRADTCVIDGMPGAARALGAGLWDLTPDEMGEVLRRAARG